LVANYGSASVTPLSFSGGVWTAGSNVTVGTNPQGVAISPDGLRALVANYGSASVTPLSFSGGVWTAGSNVTVGTNPQSLGPSMIFESL
jgi:DNA-binding beta-propeller fold protein YncE